MVFIWIQKNCSVLHLCKEDSVFNMQMNMRMKTNNNSVCKYYDSCWLYFECRMFYQKEIYNVIYLEFVLSVEKRRELARKGSVKNGTVGSPVNQQPKKNNAMARTRWSNNWETP